MSNHFFILDKLAEIINDISDIIRYLSEIKWGYINNIDENTNPKIKLYVSK